MDIGANDNMNTLDLDLELDLSLNVNVISPMWPENDLTLADEFPSTDFVWDAQPIEGFEDFAINIDSSSSKNNDAFEPAPEPIINTCDSLFELEVFHECFKDIELLPVDTVDQMGTDPIIEWNRRRSLLYDKNEFVQSEGRQRQERRVKASPTPTPTPASTEQRTYRCSVQDCDKTYYKASHLKSHMRRHSGVKPFACDWDGCKWRFSRSDELARHKRSHSGIKPYSCDLCDKAFSRSDHLSKHAKVHMKKLALYGTPIITKKSNYKYFTFNRIPVE